MYLYLNILSPHLFFFFFNDPPTPEIYPFPLPDALPIFLVERERRAAVALALRRKRLGLGGRFPAHLSQATRESSRSREPRYNIPQRAVDARGEEDRSEEHTSELQSLAYLVCRLLLEKKK